MNSHTPATSTSGSDEPAEQPPPDGGSRFQKPDAAIDRSRLGPHRPPRRGEVLVVAVERDRRPRRRTAAAGSAASAAGGVANSRPDAEHDVVVAVLGDRDDVAGGLAGEPRADGVVVDALAQQHRRPATARCPSAGRTRSSPARPCPRRRRGASAGGGEPGGGERSRRTVGGVGGAAGVDLVATAAPGPDVARRRRRPRRAGSIAAASGTVLSVAPVGQRRLGDVDRRRCGRRSCRRS